MNLKEALELIRVVPDFPKPGIIFQDITPLLSNAEAFNLLIIQMIPANIAFDCVAGMEARGFIFASAMAKQSNRGFIPIRKSGKLPSATYAENYSLEYGQDALEIHQDACTIGANVLIVDDVLATGGTACAAIRLIEKTGAKVSNIVFLLEIIALGGREKIEKDFPHITIDSIKKI